ncbi:MAG: hypothetical protein WD535_00350 [Thermaerobacterales bacterium]
MAASRHNVSPATDAIEFCYRQGWTDGLPVVPPTTEKVDAMIAAGAKSPQHILGTIPERRRSATVEKVAVNAVMAGCLPEYFPVVSAAVEAMLADDFAAHGPTASTAGAGMLVIVHGPVARRLGVNSGNNLFGPGARANATIGRAVRLTLLNILGSVPGVTDMSTLGHPGKYTYCIAEDEDNSPWTPFHVDQGFKPGDSAVTVIAAEGPRQIGNHIATAPEPILTCIADHMAALGTGGFGQGQYLAVIGREHALTISEHGWGKEKVKEFLARKAVRSLAALKEAGIRPGRPAPGDQFKLIPAARDAGDIYILVGGGRAGRFSAICPFWSSKEVGRAVTRPV